MGKFRLKNLFKMPKKVQSADCVQGLSVGLNKGFVVSQNSNRRVKPSNRKGKVTARISLLTETVKTVAGFSPFEKRAIEMFKVGNVKVDKRARRFLNKRLGSWKRAMKKTEELQNLLKKKK